MNIINIALGVDSQPCSSITLGRRGENEVTQVVVDFSSWVEEFGTGVITLLAMRSQDTSAYPVVLTLDGSTATWDVTSTDAAYKGSGRAEYIYTVGEQIAKSVVFNTVVMQDIGEPSETPPDPYEDWLERLTELGAETQANADAAQQSAEDAEQSAQEAAQEAANAEGYAEQAGESASAAQSAEADSESARDAAQTAQASAEASATAASGYAASAASSATAAASSATAAAGSASDASSSASAASDSAIAAGDAEIQAEAAKTAAQTAQSAAEDAAADAQQAAQQAHVEYEQLSDAVDELADEVSQQKSAIDDLTALTNRKAGMLVDTASGAVASFVPDSTIPALLGVSVDIEPVQAGSGDPSPDNVRPFSGWTGCNVTRTGKNLWKSLDSRTINGVTLTVDDDGGCSLTGTATANAIFIMPVTIPPGSYYLSAHNSDIVGRAVRIMLVNSTSGAQKQLYLSVVNAAGPVTLDTEYNQLRIQVNVGFTFTSTKFYPQLELGSTATAYEPFVANDIFPITFPASAGTVYAGTLDVTNGTLSAYPHYPSYNGETLVGPWLSSMDVYAEGATPTIGAEVVDMGGTPTVYDIDPVQIAAIAGQTNNVWAGAGDVAVEFAADLKHYIDSKIAAAVAALS